MSGARPAFEPLEHTSEEGVVARGATLAEAFANAGVGMYALMLELEDIEDREERSISLAAASREQLLVDWLHELLFLTETEGLVFRSFAIDELSTTRLAGRARGERFDPDRHRSHQVVVKAATEHLLEIAWEDPCWRVQVLFDI